MMRLVLLACVALLLVSSSLSSSELYPFSGKVQYSAFRLDNGSLFPNPELQPRDLFRSTRLILSGDGAQFVARTSAQGTFVFHHVPPGAYLLEVEQHDYTFSIIRVDISRKNAGQVKVKHYITGRTYETPLVIYPRHRTSYFEAEKPFSIIGILYSNPMVWMVGGMMLMGWLTQYLADPQTLQELRGRDVAAAPGLILKNSFAMPQEEWVEAEMERRLEEDAKDDSNARRR